MKLEIWMIIGIGIALAIGLGAVTVLILGLHAEVRRLTKLADSAQRLLTANLRQILPAPATVVAQSRPADPPLRLQQQSREIALPELAMLSAATAAAERQPIVRPPNAGLETQIATTAGLDWNPDRRLLVTRLASRGQQPEQIAAALRIPEREVEQFLDANQVLSRNQTVTQTPQ